MVPHRPPWLTDEPTAAELAEIEREWPLIEAELAVLDAELAILNARGEVSELDRRRLRRAEARVLREAAAFAANAPAYPREAA